MADIEIAGLFWDSEAEAVAKGWFLAGDGLDRPEVQVLSPIVEERSVVREFRSEHQYSTSYRGDAESIIADFKHRTILGEFDDGRKISLLKAQGGTRESRSMFGLGQGFRAYYAVIGAHVSLDQRYAQARYAVADRWIESLVGSRCGFAALGGGEVCVYQEDGQTWLQFEFTAGGRIREYGDLAFLPFQSLSLIALDRNLNASTVQMRIDQDSPWLDLYTYHRAAKPDKGKSPRPVLSYREITIERAAAWLEVNEQAEGLVDAVAGFEVSGPIEVQAITCTAIAEGVHRKLFRDSVRFPTLDKPATKAVLTTLRTAAKDAAREALKAAGVEDEQGVASLDGTLAMFIDVSYRQRLVELAATAHAIYPTLLAAFKCWDKSVSQVRNGHVHQLDDAKRDKATTEQLEINREHFLDLTLAVVYSVPWVLKLVFLDRAGFPHHVLADALDEHAPFEFDTENIKWFLSDHPDRAVNDEATTEGGGVRSS